MATSRNEFTGAKLQTRPANNAYYSGWDAIFGNKKEAEPVAVEEVVEAEEVSTSDDSDK